jgi:hypothetical protein
MNFLLSNVSIILVLDEMDATNDMNYLNILYIVHSFI